MINENFNSKLIFGDKYASINYDAKLLANQLSKIVPSLQYLESIDKKNKFLGKSYNVKLNDLKICANFMAPSKIYATSSNEYTLMIPIKGSCKTTVENKDFLWGEKTFAYCKPRCEGNSVSTKDKNIVLFDISPEKFNQQAQIMLGEKSKNNFYNFENPSLIALNYHGISFDTIIKQFCKILDVNLNSIQNLEKARFDELIYRTFVMMFLPERFYTSNLQNQKNKISTSTIKLLKELENEHYFSFMTLSDLENFLDLSTRNLQLLFKKNFGMTPTQFLREQKLKYARKLLLESDNSINITQISTEIGFFNFSQFAKYYKEYYGITPSETRKLIK